MWCWEVNAHTQFLFIMVFWRKPNGPLKKAGSQSAWCPIKGLSGEQHWQHINNGANLCHVCLMNDLALQRARVGTGAWVEAYKRSGTEWGPSNPEFTCVVPRGRLKRNWEGPTAVPCNIRLSLRMLHYVFYLMLGKTFWVMDITFVNKQTCSGKMMQENCTMTVWTTFGYQLRILELSFCLFTSMRSIMQACVLARWLIL